MSLILVRRAQLEDYDTYVAMLPELGVDDPIPGARIFEQRILPGTLIAEALGSPVGVIWFQIVQDFGYVKQLIVAPDARRQGVGKRLMQEAASLIRAAGCVHWCLSVKPDNVPAVSLYRQLGMHDVNLSVALRVSWDVVRSLPDPDELSQHQLLDPTRASLIEQELRLPNGQLARALEADDCVTVELRDMVDATVGVAAFYPSFPGASPFCVTQVQWAKPLLATLEPYSREETPYLQIVAGASSPLAELLQSHGASVRFEILRLEGSLG